MTKPALASARRCSTPSSFAISASSARMVSRSASASSGSSIFISRVTPWSASSATRSDHSADRPSAARMVRARR